MKLPLPPEIAAAMEKLKSLPPLGDPGKLYPVSLTEPEVNSIYAAVGFMREACKGLAFLKPFWEHYGPTLELLSARLTVFDDEP